MKKALMHYFSGTGNTFHMAKVIEDRIKLKGYKVEYNNIECETKETLDEFDLHIFLYPIYGFGTPSIVLRYLKNLKPIKASKTSIICSCAGFEGQSLSHVKSILNKKGYDVFLTDIGVYPDNWTHFSNPIDEKDQIKALENADVHIRELADKIANSETSIKKRSILNLAWSWLIFILFSSLGRRVLGKIFIADTSCTSCRKCIKTCPVNALELSNAVIKWKWNCENCQRCMNICPVKSIQTSILRLVSFILISVLTFFALVNFNEYYKLHTIINIPLYILLTAIGIFIVDVVLSFIERSTLGRKISQVSFTKKNRRYFVKEFKKTF